VRARRGIATYVAVQFAVTAAATVGYLWIEGTASWAFLAAASTVFLVTLLAWGGLLESRRWAWPVEGARLAASVAVLLWWRMVA
jgi:hypothetical protein